MKAVKTAKAAKEGSEGSKGSNSSAGCKAVKAAQAMHELCMLLVHYLSKTISVLIVSDVDCLVVTHCFVVLLIAQQPSESSNWVPV